MDHSIIAALLSAAGSLALFAFGYGRLTDSNTNLQERVKCLEGTFERYVTREEFRSLERRFDNLENKIDRILEAVGRER